MCVESEDNSSLGKPLDRAPAERKKPWVMPTVRALSVSKTATAGNAYDWATRETMFYHPTS